MNMARNVRIGSVAAFSLGVVVGAAAATAFPAGRYGAGGMTIDFGADGRFHVIEGGQSVVEGTYRTQGDSLTFTDVSGPLACTGKNASGMYAWRLDESALMLTKIDDPCDDRASDLSGHALQRQ